MIIKMICSKHGEQEISHFPFAGMYLECGCSVYKVNEQIIFFDENEKPKEKLEQQIKTPNNVRFNGSGVRVRESLEKLEVKEELKETKTIENKDVFMRFLDFLKK